MASRDYILCKYCECKLVYDGYDSIREGLEQTYGTTQLVCPDCLKKLEEIVRESEQKLKPAPVECEPVDFEYAIEQAYWDFDAKRNGDGKYKLNAMSERDAFKSEMRKLVRSGIDEETRRMVLELCDKYEMECERTMISSDEHDPLIQQLRERMGNHD